MNVIWFVPPAVALIAQSRGLLPEAGVAVKAAVTTSSDEQFEALRAGHMDVAITAMDNVMGWNSRGEGGDFAILAQIETTTPLTLMAAPHVTSSAGLAGRDVLVDSRHNGFVVALLNWLSDAGLDLADINLVEAGGVKERLQALVSCSGDATLLGPPFDGMAAAQGMLRLACINEAYPEFPGQGLVVRRSSLDRIAGELDAWVKALDAARRLGRADPRLAQSEIEASGFPGPAAVAMAAAIPETLRPDPRGLALLFAQRNRLGLPGAGGDWQDVVLTDVLSPLQP